MMNHHARGFSLVELLITVAIVAILTAVALPSYRQYVMRSNRADATSALLQLAGAQERFYLQNNTYADDDQLDDAAPAGLGFDGTQLGLYDITLAPDGGDYLTGFVLTATATGSQADDEDCQTFTVNHQGERTALDSGGGDNTERCWR